MAVLLAGLSATLGGCLTPLYMDHGSGISSELRAIYVDGVPDQLGHYLRDQLITDLNGTGDKPTPRYRLILSTREHVQTALIDSISQRAQDGAVVTDVTYSLVPMGGGAPIANGTVTSAAIYDRSAQRFANIRAARDAEIRNAKTLADLLTTQLAAKLAGVPVAP